MAKMKGIKGIDELYKVSIIMLLSNFPAVCKGLFTEKIPLIRVPGLTGKVYLSAKIFPYG